ncbi:hypothetical protein PIB30_018239 [Stylosanthes scabra]|uniref:Clathrin/coatomer adaptor adaptin-like N-terminal domain-containing protein n=1 Tax=Stylosanthes scabra TaxID=79078 RepID=A0ABU6V9G9_9FABA|nr:hypothetical protein [Stylosanthes scabra]
MQKRLEVDSCTSFQEYMIERFQDKESSQIFLAPEGRTVPELYVQKFEAVRMDKVVYMVTSSLLNENHDFLRLAINTVHNDIIGRSETFQCLALTMGRLGSAVSSLTVEFEVVGSNSLSTKVGVGTIGGKEFAESLAPDVQKLLFLSRHILLVPIVFSLRVDRMAQLLYERDLGVLTSSMSLLVALVSNNPQEYTYYGILSPWLQVKTMRALQYFPMVEDPNTRRSLFEVLQRILMGTDVVKYVNKNNASHAVLFEALALVMHLDAEREMMTQCVSLGKFISVHEPPNIQYLVLENMTRVLMVTDRQAGYHKKKHQAQIITSPKDPDISIRRRALDLLYGICYISNAKDIVE